MARGRSGTVNVLSWLKVVAIVAAFMAAGTSAATARTWYVRTDGGTATQCNGTADASVSRKPNCAWRAPTIPLPMGNSEYGGVIPRPLIRPGDTLVIGPGSYMVGLGAPGNAGNICAAGQPYECVIASIPSGIDAAHPTIVTGDCAARPELWGKGGLHGLFWLRKVHDIKIACLEITDHSTCIMNYGPTSANGGVIPCRKNSEDPFAMDGIEAVDVTNLALDRVLIHGFAQYGIVAGQLHGHTQLDDVTIRANGWGGWNGDLSGLGIVGGSGNDGTLTFNKLKVEWNGCGEAYPAATIVGCWGQSNGGYGDGLGTAATGGDWIFNDARFIQNTSDGLDLLYHSLGGTVTINGGVFWGNIGNQIKVAGNAMIENAVVNGMCNNFAAYPVGGASGNPSNDCRASGTAIVMTQCAPNQTSSISYSTVTGNGDELLIGEGCNGVSSGGSDYVPVASNIWTYDNNIFLGQLSAYKTDEQTALDWYPDGGFGGTVKYLNNIVWNVKRNRCPGDSICTNPRLQDPTLKHFNPALLPGSPAAGAARRNGKPARPANIGAVQ